MTKVVYAITSDYSYDFGQSAQSKIAAAGCIDTCITNSLLEVGTSYFEAADYCGR